MGIRHEQANDDAIEDRKISHHAHDCFLLSTFDMGGADEFGGVSELRACPRSGDDRRCFAAPHQRPRISLQARSSFNGDGLAGEHGLIQQDRSFDQLYVSCNHATKRKLHGVTRYEFRSGYDLPNSIAPDGS